MEETFEVFNAQLKVPFSVIIAGPSQSGKSTFVTNLIKNPHDIIDANFDYILWFYGESIPKDKVLRADNRIKFIKGLPDELENFIDSSLNGLAVFDDLMTEVGNSELIASFFTKKTHHQNISVVFITQNFFSAGSKRKTISRNATYLVIFNDPLDQSVARILGQRLMPGAKGGQTFTEIYNHAVSKPHGYLFIDGHQHTPIKAKFRSDIFNGVQRVFIPKKL